MRNAQKKPGTLLKRTALAVIFAIACNPANIGNQGITEPQKIKKPETTVKETPLPDKKNCAANSDIIKLQQKFPKASVSFNFLSQLPLSGKAVYNALTKQKNKIIFCVMTNNDNTKRQYGEYTNNVIYAKDSAGTKTYAHESFHAFQDINSDYNKIIYLNDTDIVFNILLLEATATAYELIIEQESKNNNLELPKEDKKITNFILSSDNPDVRQLFQSGYNDYLNNNTRENIADLNSKALEYAGQAVVMYLLNGHDAEWTRSYTSQALVTIKKYKTYREKYTLSAQPEPYAILRDNLFLNLGKVSEYINLTPKECAGTGAEKFIAKIIKAQQESLSQQLRSIKNNPFINS